MPGADLILCLVALVVGAALIVVQHKTNNAFSEVNLRRIPPPPHIEKFALGYNETLADMLWIRVLQDIDLCENAPKGQSPGVEVRGPNATCTRGWSFQMLDAITNLSPRWRLPYAIGGSLLSFMVDDREGASELLEKGIKQFPTDYNLNYFAAYHYIYELKNPKRAAETLIAAAKAGGPPWFYSLAAKMYSEAGQDELARTVLLRELENLKDDPKAQVRIRWRLEQLEEKSNRRDSQAK